MKRILSLSCFLFLAACGVHNTNVSGEWDCPAQQGSACSTIEQADNNLSTASQITSPQISQEVKVDEGLTLSDRSVGLAPSQQRVRQSEVLGKIWFYPFVDENNHYHEGGYVHVILRPADWKTDPAHLFPKDNSPKGENK